MFERAAFSQSGTSKKKVRKMGTFHVVSSCLTPFSPAIFVRGAGMSRGRAQGSV